jgi:mono/diheme cytochrome c family protein
MYQPNNKYGPVLSALLLVFGMAAFINFLSTRSADSIKAQKYTVHQQRPADPLPEITPAIETGKQLFNQMCLACHRISGTHVTILGFENRGPWADRQKLWEWLVDPKGFMKKDKYTAGLYEEFKVMQTPFPDITRQQSDAIADYLIYVNKSKGKY